LQTADPSSATRSCGRNWRKVHKSYAKFKDAPKIDEDFQKKGNIVYPKDNKLKSECGFEIDLGGFRNDIETETGKKLIV
jgi:hypothetical protein